MTGVRARVVVCASAALVAAGSALSGCGRSLGGGTAGTGRGGTVGTGGETAGTGRGGTAGTGDAATAGTGGTVGDAGSDFGQPACPSSVYMGGSCTPADIQLCYKTCGPEIVGVRAETCRNGIYDQMSGCLFDPSRDYACYRIPATANTACPANVMPQSSTPCDVPHCTLCNSLQGTVGGGYLDSTGAAKPGYCVCQPPSASGTRTWSCASDTAWPCPSGLGCVEPGPFVSEPACPPTVAAGGACTTPTTPTDPGYCYKPCGPQNTGVRQEVCMLVYLERDCAFDPSKDYSCYKIPTAANVACPVGVTPQSSMVCDVPACTPCNSLGGAAGGGVLDAAGAVTRAGWCVCQPPDASGTRTWSCASDTEWPCPRGPGC